MITLLTTGLTLTLACLLAYRLKSRSVRKWLGIVLTTLGAIVTFTFIPDPDEFHVGMVFFIIWMCGLHLFFERGRYEDEE
jgi:hypothetical protein